MAPAQCRFRLDERLQHAVEIDFGDAYSAVTHAKNETVRLKARADLDHAAGRRELHRVVHEVEQHLFQLALVAPNQRQIGRDADQEVYAGVAGTGAQHALDPLGNLLDVDIAFEQHHLAGFGFGEIENVVDDVQKVATAGMDVRDVAAVLLVYETALVPHHQVGESDDRVQRRAQLVADLGEKFDLDPVRFLGRVLGMPDQFDAAVGEPPHLALLDALLDGGN